MNEPWIVCYGDMPIKGNALRLAWQLTKFWLAGERSIRFEVKAGEPPVLTFRRSALSANAGNSNG